MRGLSINTMVPSTSTGPLSCQLHQSRPAATPRGFRSVRGPTSMKGFPADSILSARGKKLFWASLLHTGDPEATSIVSEATQKPANAPAFSLELEGVSTKKLKKQPTRGKRPLIHRSYGIIPFHCGPKDKNDLSYLLVTDWRGDVGFPKGYGKKGEHKIVTAKREFQEETGITSKCLRMNPGFGKYESVYECEKGGRAIHKTSTYFPAELLAKHHPSSKLIDDAEIQGVMWVSYKEAQEVLTHNENKEALQSFHAVLLARDDSGNGQGRGKGKGKGSRGRSKGKGRPRSLSGGDELGSGSGSGSGSGRGHGRSSGCGDELDSGSGSGRGHGRSSGYGDELNSGSGSGSGSGRGHGRSSGCGGPGDEKGKGKGNGNCKGKGSRKSTAKDVTGRQQAAMRSRAARERSDTI